MQPNPLATGLRTRKNGHVCHLLLNFKNWIYFGGKKKQKQKKTKKTAKAKKQRKTKAKNKTKKSFEPKDDLLRENIPTKVTILILPGHRFLALYVTLLTNGHQR